MSRSALHRLLQVSARLPKPAAGVLDAAHGQREGVCVCGRPVVQHFDSRNRRVSCACVAAELVKGRLLVEQAS